MSLELWWVAGVAARSHFSGYLHVQSRHNVVFNFQPSCLEMEQCLQDQKDEVIRFIFHLATQKVKNAVHVSKSQVSITT